MSRSRVAIYVRISKDRDDQISTEVQEGRCREYAAGQDWDVAAVYSDIGRSAFKQNVTRPRLDELLAEADAGAFDALIVYRLDRLARSVVDFADIWRRLDGGGCEFVSASEHFDTRTAMGRAMVQIAGVFAELESGIRSERITDWHRARTAAGKPHSGPSPYGYTSKWEVDPDQAGVVRRIADQVLGGSGLLPMARDLNADGITPPGRARSGGRNEWTATTVKRTMTRPAIAGLREVDGAFVEGSWPAILDRSCWEQVRAALAKPPGATNTKGGERRYLLSGLLACGRCGAELYGSKRSRDGAPRYACRKRAGRPDACMALSIDGRSTDDFVLALAREALNGASLPTITEPDAKASAAASTLQGDLDELARAFGAGEITIGEWHAAAGPLRDRLEIANEPMAPRPPSTLRLDDLDQLSTTEQHQVVRWLFTRLEVAPHDRSAPRNLSKPEHRLTVEWRT